MTRPLRDYQARGVDMLRASLRNGKRRPVLQMPTGAGKTRVAAEVISLARQKGHRCIFTVPRISLIDQTVLAFMHEGVSDLGVIQQNHALTNPAQPIQIASLDTLAKREVPSAGLVIVDECHLQREFVLGWMARPEWQRVPFIGLSATPWSKGMGRHWDDLVIVATTQQLIDQGHLSPFRVFAAAHPDLSGIKTVAGDFHEAQLAERMSDAKLVGDVVQVWLEKGRNEPTLCFGVNRAHAKHLQDRFDAAGVASAYQDCNTPLEERASIAKRFRSGDVRVICNVGTMTTGVDLDVRTLILARPTKSEILACQIVGRALRPAPGKEFATILDHSDTTLRLGFVTDIHHEHLDCGDERQKQERSAPLPKECPSCSFLKPPRMVECPNCGFRPVHMPKGVKCEAGELVEVTPRKLNLGSSVAEKAAFYAQLKGYVAERGHKEGFAAAKFREKFGTWPNDPRIRYVEPVEPTPAVRNWIKSRQIAWAHSKRNTGGSYGVAAE